MNTTAHASNGYCECSKSSWIGQSAAKQPSDWLKVQRLMKTVFLEKIFDISVRFMILSIFFRKDYESTRVRGYQNLFLLQRRNAFGQFLQGQRAMQRMFKGLFTKLEEKKPRDCESTVDSPVRKARREVSLLCKILQRYFSREASGSAAEMGRGESGVYKREASREVSFRQRLSTEHKSSQFYKAQKIEKKYSALGNKADASTVFYGGTSYDGQYRYSTSCRPHSTVERKVSVWVDSSGKFANYNLCREQQKEQQFFGRRYSLNLLRKGKMQGLNDFAVTNWNKIFDISRIPLPFTDMIGTDSSSHPYKE
jgi:hypothetical protein